MPELPEAAVEVDHTDHEALVAVPLRSAEIVVECRVGASGVIAAVLGAYFVLHPASRSWRTSFLSSWYRLRWIDGRVNDPCVMVR